MVVWYNFSIASCYTSFELFIFLVYRQQLQEQAKLLVEENALLMEQQEIQDKKMKEMQRIHGEEGWFIDCLQPAFCRTPMRDCP